MNSHSSGCTARVKMSRWSWRSLRISACAIASVPAASAAPERERSRTLAEPAGNASPGADIREPPMILLRRPAAGDRREDLLEVRGGVRREQLCGRTLLDEVPEVHDRDALAVAFGLLHRVRGEKDRRAPLLAQHAEVLPHAPARGRVE